MLFSVLVILALRETSPRDYGEMKSQYIFQMIMIRVFFYGYNFKAQILQVIFCFAYLEIVAQHFIFEDERSLFQLIASCFGLLFLLVAFCILYQLMITWIGFKFLDAMMP